MDLKQWAAFAMGAISILGLVWAAATEIQSLKDRVAHLERENAYLHGKIEVPNK